MKTAIYIEDGIVQLVITPETDFEKKAVDTFRDKPIDAQIFIADGIIVSYADDRSLIIKATTREDDSPI